MRTKRRSEKLRERYGYISRVTYEAAKEIPLEVSSPKTQWPGMSITFKPAEAKR